MIDINKKYRTRDGHEVRIYATDGNGNSAVHGAIYKDFYDVPTGYMEWCLTCWPANGKHLLEAYDLIEVRPRHKRTVWLHVWNGGAVCATEEEYYVPAGRIACIKVELDFEEGEGL